MIRRLSPERLYVRGSPAGSPRPSNTAEDASQFTAVKSCCFATKTSAAVCKLFLRDRRGAATIKSTTGMAMKFETIKVRLESSLVDSNGGARQSPHHDRADRGSSTHGLTDDARTGSVPRFN